jgi:hypothetical protein
VSHYTQKLAACQNRLALHRTLESMPQTGKICPGSNRNALHYSATHPPSLESS